MTLADLPRLTADLPGARGVYKRRPEDFRVEEVPAYEPCGEGPHVYLSIEKTGMTTADAVRAVGRALGKPPRAFGFAGRKDARGVTRQTLSVEGVDTDRVAALALRNVSVLWVSRHKNKLRLGHTRGNRFELKLREVDPGRDGDVQDVLEVLARRGVPNYFGEQRFGARGDNWKVGRALLKGDVEEAVAQILGRPTIEDVGAVLQARELYERGEYGAAARAWPGSFRDCVRLSKAMERKRGDAKRAIKALDRKLLKFYVSAYQSHLFNQVVAERIGGLDCLMEGDLAWRHANGAVFTVLDPEVEQPRADAQEISPSGPLFGKRMTRPAGEPARIEQGILEAGAHDHDDFTRPGPLQWQGGRRPLRVPLGGLEAARGEDEGGEFLELRFALPPGSYATAVLREVLR